MKFASYDDIGWHVPPTDPADLDLDTEAPPDEPGRKFLVEGEGGFYVQTVRIPPGFVAPDHHHDHAEVFMVIDGSCTFNGRELGRLDLAVVESGETYAFTAGADGVQFLVTRQAPARFLQG